MNPVVPPRPPGEPKCRGILAMLPSCRDITSSTFCAELMRLKARSAKASASGRRAGSAPSHHDARARVCSSALAIDSTAMSSLIRGGLPTLQTRLHLFGAAQALFDHPAAPRPDEQTAHRFRIARLREPLQRIHLFDQRQRGFRHGYRRARRSRINGAIGAPPCRQYVLPRRGFVHWPALLAGARFHTGLAPLPSLRTVEHAEKKAGQCKRANEQCGLPPEFDGVTRTHSSHPGLATINQNTATRPANAGQPSANHPRIRRW